MTSANVRKQLGMSHCILNSSPEISSTFIDESNCGSERLPSNLERDENKGAPVFQSSVCTWTGAPIHMGVQTHQGCVCVGVVGAPEEGSDDWEFGAGAALHAAAMGAPPHWNLSAFLMICHKWGCVNSTRTHMEMLVDTKIKGAFFTAQIPTAWWLSPGPA